MQPGTSTERMKRPIHPMPAEVLEALTQRRLLNAYRARPGYQQNDYIGWINRARRDSTRQKRLDQMLDELAGGGLYMKMAWTAERK